ncbi:MAG: hypothetical protein HQK50_19760, partial [Oligoflexia bacterium]|nr:hypothetical protein [Oligoflexia bacterium]
MMIIMMTLKLLLLLLFLPVFFSLPLAAATLEKKQKKIHDFETTYLQSTAGTGVGSLLMDESAILNPASISFFNLSSFYLQRTTTDFKDDKSTDQ